MRTGCDQIPQHPAVESPKAPTVRIRLYSQGVPEDRFEHTNKYYCGVWACFRRCFRRRSPRPCAQLTYCNNVENKFALFKYRWLPALFNRDTSPQKISR